MFEIRIHLVEKEGVLALNLIPKLIKHNMPCLLIHDGFRIKASDKELFIQLLEDTYNNLFNVKPKLSIEEDDISS